MDETIWHPRDGVVASTPHIGYTYVHSRPDKIMKSPNSKTFADLNWNVVATTNASGTVQERMRYDAFGRITWLNASYARSRDYRWQRYSITHRTTDSSHVAVGVIINHINRVEFDSKQKSFSTFDTTISNINERNKALSLTTIQTIIDILSIKYIIVARHEFNPVA